MSILNRSFVWFLMMYRIAEGASKVYVLFLTFDLALIRYWSVISDIRLYSRMQNTSALFPIGGRTAIPSGLIRQNLCFVIVSLEWSSRTPSDSCRVHFFPRMHKNFQSGDANRSSSPWIRSQYWWWTSMWDTDRASQVCWMWPRLCLGRSFAVENRPSASQKALHMSHLSDSFPCVILRIHVVDGTLCDVACSILLWSCDLTEVIFIHSPNISLPFPSRRN